MMRLLAAVLCIVMLGCSEDQRDSSTPLADVKLEATIYWDAGYLYCGVILTRSGAAVEDAYIEVNETALPYSGGSYVGPAIPASIGDGVVLRIATHNRSIELASTAPDQPVISSPNAAGSPYLVSSEILVQWATLSPAPQQVHVWVWEGYTSDYATYAAGESEPIDLYLAGSTTWVKLAADSLATHNATTSPGYSAMALEVRAENPGDLLGLPVAVGSYMLVVSRAESEVFTTE